MAETALLYWSQHSARGNNLTEQLPEMEMSPDFNESGFG